MTIAVDDQVEADHHVLLISQLFPGAYAHQFAPHQPQGPKPRRQRRKKSKGGDGLTSGGAKKRKLSNEQVRLLEQNFGSEHKLESERKDRLASELGLDPRQVAIWFQNRRARWKTKKLEEEYAKLKSVHESTILDKCRLETEMIKLKEQLAEATGQIQKLSVSSPSLSSTLDFMVSSNNSPMSSAISDMVPPSMGEFGALELDAAAGYDELDVFYINAAPDGSNYIQSLEWFNQFL